MKKTHLSPSLILSADALREVQDALSHSIRARDELMSTVSHELRTPLASIKLQTQILQRKIKNGQDIQQEKVQSYIELVGRQTEKLSLLVDAMLDLSHISTGRLVIHPEEIDLSELVEESIHRFASKFKAHSIDVHKKIVPHIRGLWDRLRLEQVCSILFSNIIRYAAGAPLEVTLAEEKGVVLFTVRDFGLGIPKENQYKVFEKFERAGITSNEVTGLGVGLFIAKEIIELHHGTIELESQPGDGAVFRIQTPKGL